MKNTDKLESVIKHIDEIENKNKVSNIDNEEYNTFKNINIPTKINNIIIDDYYNINILNIYPNIPAVTSISDIIQQYIKSKLSKYKLMKKNEVFHKINPQFKLINSNKEEIFSNIKLDLQIIYIYEVINNLKNYMMNSVNYIMYTNEEKEYTLHNLNYKDNDNILNLLGVNHLLRFLIHSSYIVKYFYGIKTISLDIYENEINFNIFISIIEDLINFLDKIL